MNLIRSYGYRFINVDRFGQYKRAGGVSRHNAHEEVGVETVDVAGNAAQGVCRVDIEKSTYVSGIKVEVYQGNLGPFRSKACSQVYRNCCCAYASCRIVDGDDFPYWSFLRGFRKKEPTDFLEGLLQFFLGDGA